MKYLLLLVFSITIGYAQLKTEPKAHNYRCGNSIVTLTTDDRCGEYAYKAQLQYVNTVKDTNKFIVAVPQNTNWRYFTFKDAITSGQETAADWTYYDDLWFDLTIWGDSNLVEGRFNMPIADSVDFWNNRYKVLPKFVGNGTGTKTYYSGFYGMKFTKYDTIVNDYFYLSVINNNQITGNIRTENIDSPPIDTINGTITDSANFKIFRAYTHTYRFADTLYTQMRYAVKFYNKKYRATFELPYGYWAMFLQSPYNNYYQSEKIELLNTNTSIIYIETEPKKFAYSFKKLLIL